MVENISPIIWKNYILNCSSLKGHIDRYGDAFILPLFSRLSTLSYDNVVYAFIHRLEKGTIKNIRCA